MSGEQHWLPEVLDAAYWGIVAIDAAGKVVVFNSGAEKITGMNMEQVLGRWCTEVLLRSVLMEVLNTGKPKLGQRMSIGKTTVVAHCTPIIRNGELVGAVSVFQDITEIEKISQELETVKSLYTDLKAICSTAYDEILVTDNRGKILRISDVCKKFWNLTPDELVGKNVLEMERDGYFTPSVTRLVIEQKKKVSVLQNSRTGLRVFAVGNPVFDSNGNLERVVVASRDITEISTLKDELRHAKKISEQYKNEIELLKGGNEKYLRENMIFASTKMERVVENIKQVAQVDSTIMILGESGVGKEVVARAIHELSERRSKPLIKVNCGAIPESLLESELFGYARGAFTGAFQKGKAGLFELANRGTIFLDEITELPLPLQVKLLRVLQEKELIRVGGTETVKVDVRVLAACNRNLEEMVEKKLFRKDLYYRLNVIPITVPPLRERPGDIVPLTLFFLNKLNETYKRQNYFRHDALEVMEAYHWPGNVRELQNVVERLVVTLGKKIIGAEDVLRVLPCGKGRDSQKPKVTGIVPMREAVEIVENQLILMAMQQYKTTSRAADALGVSQATVSRRWQRLRANNSYIC